MLKKIRAHDLRLGMYVHQICGNWMDHSFWRNRFLLTSPEDLRKLQGQVRECWIDTSLGVDCAAPAATPARVVEDRRTVTEWKAAAVDPEGRRTVPLEEELVHARQALSRAKPIVNSMFRQARMGAALKLEGVGDIVDEIVGSVSRNAAAFLSLARLKHKDEYTYMHSAAVCGLMAALARTLKLDEVSVRSAAHAGMLHDIGKMTIPDTILNKPGKLTDAEFAQVRDHPTRGEELLLRARVTDPIVLDVCRHHHERPDGAGYPDRVSPPVLSRFARMGAVCDVYDALTSDRCYKPGWSPAVAIRHMAEWQAAGQFDRGLFHAFVRTVGIYPSGTLVRLSSDRLAVVAEQGAGNALTPVVDVVYSIKARRSLVAERIDLARIEDPIVGVEDPAQWRHAGLAFAPAT